MYQNRTHPSEGTVAHRGTAPAPHVVQHDFDGSADVSTTLVHAVADVRGVDVTDAEYALRDAIDPDALDLLFGTSAETATRLDGHLTVGVCGTQVTVYGDGHIAVRPPHDATPGR